MTHRYSPFALLRVLFNLIRGVVLIVALIVFSGVGGALGDDGLPAFPGAEGFGATTAGGRGGTIVEVTNLNDAGPGSLREAIGKTGPRIVVFRVGGTIEVSSPLAITEPFITIAGQTAPGDGIAIKNGPQNTYAPLQVKTHDVVIRYLRSRPGASGVPRAGQEGSNVDALTIADPQADVFNVVVDHCSFSWSIDEVVNSWYDARDITVQWCIMAEGLHNPPLRQGAGSKGPLFGGKGGGNVSLHHNLLAHNLGRNPMIKGSGVFDVVNNVIFVPRTIAAVIDGELGACGVNLVGNRVIAPHGDGLVYGARVLGPRPVSLFVQGNLGPHRTSAAQPESLFVSPQNNSRERIVEARHESPLVTTHGADEAFRQVLASAGCNFPARDAVDRRIVDDVTALRTRLIVDPAEVGGWPELKSADPPADADHDGMPDDWERRRGFDPSDPADGAGDADGDGYTNVEAYLSGAISHAD